MTEQAKHDAQVDRYVTLGEAMRLQTIERCAQVVRRYAVNIGEMSEIIAVEIEALKEP